MGGGKLGLATSWAEIWSAVNFDRLSTALLTAQEFNFERARFPLRIPRHFNPETQVIGPWTHTQPQWTLLNPRRPLPQARGGSAPSPWRLINYRKSIFLCRKNLQFVLHIFFVAGGGGMK